MYQKAGAADAAILDKKIADASIWAYDTEVADQTHFGEAHIALCLRKSADISSSFPPSVRVDRLGRQSRGRCEAADRHATLGQEGHEIAAWLAVVVAVEGTAVDVGQLRCRDPELLRLRKVELASGEERHGGMLQSWS